MRVLLFMLVAGFPWSELTAQTRTAVSTDTASDRRAVMAVVQRFFDGMKQRDTTLVRAQFLPTARFYGMRTRPNGDTVVQVLTIDEFTSFIARDTRPSWTERAFDAEVRVHRSLATVWAWYDFHFGTTFSHCGVDAVQLLRTPTGWKIASISDTYETTDCIRRTPP